MARKRGYIFRTVQLVLTAWWESSRGLLNLFRWRRNNFFLTQRIAKVGAKGRRGGRRIGLREAVMILVLSLIVSQVLSFERVFGREVKLQDSLLISQVSNSANLALEGKKLFDAGKFEEAAQVWQQAAQAYQAQGDMLNSAMAFSNLSLSYQKLEQWPQATEAIEKGISLLPSGNSKDELKIRAQSFDIQGSLRLEVGKSQAATDSWKEAVKLYTQLGDENSKIQSQINLAQAWQALGHYRLAEGVLKEIQQTLANQPDSLMKSRALRSLGDVWREIGELDDSQKVLEQSWEIAQGLQSPEDESASLLSLGNTAQASAKRAQDYKNQAKTEAETKAAQNYYQEAREISNSPLTKLKAQLNELSLLIKFEQLSEAEALLPKIKIQLATLSASRTGIYAQINFAQSLLKLRQVNAPNPPTWLEIDQILTSAVQQAESINDMRADAYALSELGYLYEQQALSAVNKTEKNQLFATAKAKTQQALNWADDINASAPDIAYLLEWQMGRLFNAQGDSQSAIASYDTAYQNLKSLRTDLGTINRAVKFSFQEGVEPVYRQYVELLLQDEQPLPKNLDKARQVIDSLQIAELDNFFQNACSEAKAVTLDEVVNNYDPTSAILYSIVLEKKLALIIKLPHQKDLFYYQTPLSSKEEVNDTVTKIYDTFKLTDRILSDVGLGAERKLKQNEEELQVELKQVYSWLIPPVIEASLANSQVKTLVFVLDGALQKVPVAALYDGKQYLVQKANVALSLGLQLLSPQPIARKNIKVLAGGLSQEVTINGHIFPALPKVQDELLSEIKPKVPTEVLLNKDFTVANFQKQINSSYTVIHLATHGTFSSNPEDTFLVTENALIRVKELDKLLGISDRSATKPIELLVLSACETAAGERRAALGLAGVAVQAGARSTIASLWSAADPAAAALMGPFYQALKDSKVSKAEALRSAQLQLLQNPKFSAEFHHPYYWAPFVLVGNWL